MQIKTISAVVRDSKDDGSIRRAGMMMTRDSMAIPANRVTSVVLLLPSFLMTVIPLQIRKKASTKYRIGMSPGNRKIAALSGAIAVDERPPAERKSQKSVIAQYTAFLIRLGSIAIDRPVIPINIRSLISQNFISAPNGVLWSSNVLSLHPTTRR